MNIKYDTSWYYKGGIGKYSEEIGKRLRGVKYFSFKGNPASPLFALKLTYEMILNRKSFFILPGYIPPLFIKDRFFFTIHDLNHLDISDNSSFIKRLFYKYVIKKGCHNASGVLTVSEFSKERIVKWSGVDPEKVFVVGNGVESCFRPIERKSEDIRNNYLLCVSNRKLHKNERRSIESFASSDINKDIKLVITGNRNKELDDFIAKEKISERITFTGHLTEDELISLYQNSLALIFPSLYEGFGIPVLEAMACGIPVITSKTTALVEIAGEAALLVDPESKEEIKSAIEKIISDPSLREELIDKGLKRSKEFTWDKTVGVILERLKKIGIVS